LIAARFRRKSAESGSTASNAANSWRTDEPVSSPAGRGLENSFEMNSARSADVSMSALYIRCAIMLPRRMSKMIAIFGWSATM
jgi:hypothetical protein